MPRVKKEHDMDGLRTHLYEVIEALKGEGDEETKIDIPTAEAIVKVAATIVSTVKAETAFVRAAGGRSRTRMFKEVSGDDDRPGPRRLTEAG